MTNAQVFREQRMEMTNTFAAIRQKIADAQIAIRNFDAQSKEFERRQDDAEARYQNARDRCVRLREQIAERERDLSDAENQIPLAKSRMHELDSMSGENLHFQKLLERTRKEVKDLEKKRADVHELAKQKSEECWNATQKMHRLEVRIGDMDKRLEFAVRRIIVAQEKLSVVEVQTNAVSKNYTELSKTEMEERYYEKQRLLNEAKERRKASEEKAMQLTWQVEEIDNELIMYQSKMQEMFSGQRELASSKLL